MQIKTGTASVTNGSNRVIFATADLSAITLRALFSLDRVVGAPVYPIVDVRKPAASGTAWTNSASGLWEVFLAVPYAQPTNAATAFLIQKDFLDIVIFGTVTKYYIAQFEVTDTQTMPLINLNFAAVVNAFASVQTAPKFFYNADQALYFPIGITGAAGEEIIGITGPGIS